MRKARTKSKIETPDETQTHDGPQDEGQTQDGPQGRQDNLLDEMQAKYRTKNKMVPDET